MMDGGWVRALARSNRQRERVSHLKFAGFFQICSKSAGLIGDPPGVPIICSIQGGYCVDLFHMWIQLQHRILKP